MMDVPLNQEIYIPSPNDGRQVKVMIKEVYKHTAACNACRTRKRKCDGKAPCSYCQAKKQPCEFSQQRKRGPPRRQSPEESVNNTIGFVAKDFSVNAATLENYMMDFVEAKGFIDYYWSYIKHRMPGDSPQFILQPSTTADKIQAYATLAFASRISGNGTKAATYIAQARQLAGSIFDSPQADSVAALVMMSHYWQLVLDLPLARFYSELALALGRLTPTLTSKLQTFVKIGNILTQDRIPRRAKSELVKQEIAKSTHHIPWPGCPFMAAAADLMGILGFNVLFPEEIAVKKFFHVIDDVRINEEDRSQIVSSINDLRLHATLNAQTIGDILFYDMFCSLYQAITEWKSGHIHDALSCAKACINGIQQLNSFKQLGIASDFPHICMLGSLCKLLYEHGENKCVLQICQFIREVCKIMQPEFNFITTMIDDFLESNNITDPDPTSSDPTYRSPSSISPSPSPPSPLSPASPDPSLPPTHSLTPTHNLPPTRNLPPTHNQPPTHNIPAHNLSPTHNLPPTHNLSTQNLSTQNLSTQNLPSMPTHNQPPTITQRTFTAHTLHPFHPYHAVPRGLPGAANPSNPLESSAHPTDFQITTATTQMSNFPAQIPDTLTNYHTTNYQHHTQDQTTNFYTPDQFLQVISDPAENPYPESNTIPTVNQPTNFYSQNTHTTNVQTTNTLENYFLDNLLSSTVDNVTFDGPLIDL